MIKKILFISFLCLSTTVFSQKTLSKLVAAPNPFTHSTTVKFNSTKKQPIFFIVKNVLGKTVYTKPLKTVKGINKFYFYRNDLQAGIYLYSIRNNEEIISKRFVIK